MAHQEWAGEPLKSSRQHRRVEFGGGPIFLQGLGAGDVEEDDDEQPRLDEGRRGRRGPPRQRAARRKKKRRSLAFRNPFPRTSRCVRFLCCCGCAPCRRLCCKPGPPRDGDGSGDGGGAAVAPSLPGGANAPNDGSAAPDNGAAARGDHRDAFVDAASSHDDNHNAWRGSAQGGHRDAIRLEGGASEHGADDAAPSGGQPTAAKAAADRALAVAKQAADDDEADGDGVNELLASL